MPVKFKNKKFTMLAWMETYRELIGNTGGNSVEELMNDSDSNFQNNLVRTTLKLCVESQVHLLMRLKEKNLLNKG